MPINPTGSPTTPTFPLSFFGDTGNIVQVPGVVNPTINTSAAFTPAFVNLVGGTNLTIVLTTTPTILNLAAANTPMTITIPIAGTYLVCGSCLFDTTSASYAALGAYAAVLIARNGTEINGSGGSVPLPVLTAQSLASLGTCDTANNVIACTAGDTLSLMGFVSALPSAGTVSAASATVAPPSLAGIYALRVA